MDDVCAPQDVSESAVCDAGDGGQKLQDEVNACSIEEEREIRSDACEKVCESATSVLPDMDICEDVCDDDSVLGLEDESKKPEDNLADDQLECSPPSTREDVGYWLYDNFDRLDKDSDGYISESEVDKAVTDPSYTGVDGRMVHMLKSRQDDIEELNDDEIGDENDGITRSDVFRFKQRLGEHRKEVKNVGDAVGRGVGDFEKLDTDGDGHLTADEMGKALEDKNLSKEDKAAYELLKNRVGDIEEASNDEYGDENDGMTRDDINQYYNDVLNSDLGKLFNGVDSDLYRAQNRVENATERGLYGNDENPLESIRPDAINQGQMGDCYFLAALSSMASTEQGKEAIDDMIRENEDGTYTVTFPGAPDEPVTVTAPTDAELARYGATNENGTWAHVLEKAYGQYCNESVFRRSPVNPMGGDVPHEGAEGGSLRNHGLRILTGKDVDTENNMATSNESIHENLKSAFEDGRPVTAYINGELFGDNRTDDAGLPMKHEYAVTGYDPVTQEITIRNPWGRGEPMENGKAKDGKDDGVFKMTLDEFNKNFSGLAYTEA